MTRASSASAEFALEFPPTVDWNIPIYAKADGLVSYGANNFELLKQVGYSNIRTNPASPKQLARQAWLP